MFIIKIEISGEVGSWHRYRSLSLSLQLKSSEKKWSHKGVQCISAFAVPCFNNRSRRTFSPVSDLRACARLQVSPLCAAAAADVLFLDTMLR